MDRLIDALRNPDGSVRRNAVAVTRTCLVLANHLVDRLLGLTRDPDVMVRRRILKLFTQLNLTHAGQAVDVLVGAMNDEDAQVRRGAIKAIRHFTVDIASRAVPALIKALKDEDPLVCCEAIVLLRALGPEAEAAVQALVEAALESEDDAVGQAVVRTLVKVDPRGELTLQAVTGDYAARRLIKLLRGIGEWGRSLTSKLQSRANEAPPPVVSKVTIGLGQNDYFLEADEVKKTFSVPGNYKPIIALFAGKLIKNSPHEVVTWGGLNEAVGANDREKADRKKAAPVLRKNLQRLNTEVCKVLGRPANGEPWFETVRRKGVRLNSSVTWSLSKAMQKELGRKSPHDFPTNPKILEESQSARGY
jgi:hypothetical protein